MGGLNSGGRAARALRLLLLAVFALAAVEYLFGSILDATAIKTYLYTPGYNVTQQPKKRPTEKNQWPKRYSSTIIPKGRAYTKSRIRVLYNNSTMNKNTSQAYLESAENHNHSSLLISKIMENVKVEAKESSPDKVILLKPYCDDMPPDLGPILVNTTDMNLDDVEQKYPEVQWGGRYSPPNCTAKHRVAIIVPFRDRQQHLAIFLNHMHPFLMKQQIEYGIFIIEQEGKTDFNRAKLMNVGFVESQKLGAWQCFVFHDIDLLPENTRNVYSCPRQPRHMSVSINTYHYKLPYEEIYGGVSAMTVEQFTKVNGFSNKYWGWGAEDDDMFYRLKESKYHVARYPMSVARYTMLTHKKSVPNPKRYQLLSQTSKTFHADGLSNLEYEVAEVIKNHLYTHVIANIDERS